MNAQPMKRRYTRLSEDQWREAEALWSSGSASLPELAHQFGTTERGLQAHFAKVGVSKGASAKVLAAQVVARVKQEQEAQVDNLTQRALKIRESTFDSATKVERMILERLDAAAADPTQTYAAAAAVKMLGNAAAALERLHTLKRNALGITDDHMNDDEMPTLVIRNLTDAQIVAMRQKQEEEDAFDGEMSDDADASAPVDEEIVFETDHVH